MSGRLKIAFDIGGVMSKYPDIFRPLMKMLVDGGALVFVVTDMQPLDLVMTTLRANGFDFLTSANVISANYDRHGEGCKAVVLGDIGADMMFDDFVGYLADPSAAVRCLVMPDSSRPYYHNDWKVEGGEPLFGRRVYCKETP